MSSSSSKLPLSLIVITRDEEAHIGRCLKSVPFASELLVLDSFSTDRTCEIAKAAGARVVQEKFMGFGPQKRRAVELAANDWVLCLDADEALGEAAERALRSLFEGSPPPLPAYRISRLSFHMGRWIRHGGWFPDWQTRLFDRRRAQWDLAEVHERVETKGPVGTLKAPIFHWVFDDLTDQVQTNNKYSTLGAVALSKRGKRFFLPRLFYKPILKFLETYVWKRGFLDGVPGFVIAVGAAYSVFLKYAKLWEMQRKRKGE